ncbi:MAG: hypothetical protein ACOYK7_07530, partial [Pirellulales bacterium]
MLITRFTGSPHGSPELRGTAPASCRCRVWTGTALQTARGLLATLLALLVGLTGPARRSTGSEPGSFAMNATPGAIGAWRRPQTGPCPDFPPESHVQPVAIRGPAGMQVAIET